MPATFLKTARFALRYLVLNQQARYLDDGIQALAEDIDTKIWTVGDYKTSLQAGDHGETATAGVFAWLIADAREVPAAYTDLINTLGALSNPFGVGPNGRPRLPPHKGRMNLPPGTPSGAAGATAHALGQTGGEETHILTVAELARHQHTMGDHPATTAPAGGFNIADVDSALNPATGTGFTGGDQPHNTLPPFVAAGNVFIKT